MSGFECCGADLQTGFKGPDRAGPENSVR